MANLLVQREVRPHGARRRQPVFLQVPRIGQQHRHGRLVVEKAALDVAVAGHGVAGVERHEVARAHAQRPHVLLALHVLVEHHLNVFGEIGLCRQLLLALDVQRGVGAGDEAGVFASVTRGHAHVLPLAVAGKQAAHRGQHEPSVGLDKAHHGAQRVGVGGHQGVVSLPAQEGLHPALSQPHGRIAHVLQLAHEVVLNLGDVARGAVNFHHGLQLPQQIVKVVLRHAVCKLFSDFKGVFLHDVLPFPVFSLALSFRGALQKRAPLQGKGSATRPSVR